MKNTSSSFLFRRFGSSLYGGDYFDDVAIPIDRNYYAGSNRGISTGNRGCYSITGIW